MTETDLQAGWAASTLQRHAAVLGGAIQPPLARGWTFGAISAADALENLTADCLIVNSGAFHGNVDIALQTAADTILVSFVTDSTASNSTILDQSDGFLLDDDDPDTAARVLGAAVARRRGPEVRDLSDGTARTIGELSAEASRIAEALQSLVARQTSTEPEPVTAATVRRLIRLRRDRNRFLPALLFADPAWDMLLDLTAARLEGREVPVSSLCIAAEVPTTTALRWIRTLTEAGLFERHSDPADARRNFVRLTDAAAEAMFGWLRQFGAQWAAR